MTGRPALVTAIDGSDWVTLLGHLVRAPSHPGIDRQEERAVAVLSAWLGGHGVSVATHEVSPGRPNLIASVKGAGLGLLLNAHAIRWGPV